ncbi:uncharacterized protein LOC119992055 isoform X1 [Tripterygium wilfordii]|uniref:uncharacterized protein LOC119992055 isoform X1 n=1 Tax=Tripterygium wilfordii TaxID=458696 RepID=UPI0018F86488|nr:uncharacterized protein LOC119992055 isoform X1 [Tripterygium wilfordii]
MANPRRPSRRGSFFFFFTFRPLASAITVAVLLFFVLSFLFSTSNSYSSDLHHHFPSVCIRILEENRACCSIGSTQASGGADTKASLGSPVSGARLCRLRTEAQA